MIFVVFIYILKIFCLFWPNTAFFFVVLFDWSLKFFFKLGSSKSIKTFSMLTKKNFYNLKALIKIILFVYSQLSDIFFVLLIFILCLFVYIYFLSLKSWGKVSSYQMEKRSGVRIFFQNSGKRKCNDIPSSLKNRFLFKWTSCPGRAHFSLWRTAHNKSERE